jgi:hypothetical protein
MANVNFEELETAALRLPVEARARLADRLIKSLDDLTQDEVAALWDGEAAARDRDLDAHPDHAVPAEEVLRRLRMRDRD